RPRRGYVSHGNASAIHRTPSKPRRFEHSWWSRSNLRTLYGAHESERFVEEDATRLKKVAGFVVGPAPRRSRKFSGPTRSRTENLLIKSQLLCQLSYRPVPTPPRGI